ncbi:unnamed protein product [Lactuca virosa]|uniref:F-box associated beta-propeller type 1 domain-containing protein n=1 Tax=Lactuca virosa TaxID=75947 RepID=A0AAU9MGG3_9ASTR|nr:unnamed protein product [Lactuca virosa]
MRPVSKSWNAFLSQPSFVKTHLHRSIHNNDQILLVFHYGEESYSDFKPFTAKPSLSPNLELTNFIKVPVNPKSGHTNGIKMITKVVKLTGLGGPPTYSVKWWLQVEIYSMKKGSWEVITERFPSHITNIIDDDYVCADGHDGHIHWLCRIGEKMDSKTIVAFDLGSETFGEILFPNSILQNRVNVLGVSSEKLCVMSYIENGAYEVWVMEEYGVAESWVKSHVFSQFIGDLNTCVFGFTSRNEFLIEDNGYLVLYDPIANEQKILENHCPEDYGAAKIVEYVDSLVWIEPAEHA